MNIFANGGDNWPANADNQNPPADLHNVDVLNFMLAGVRVAGAEVVDAHMVAAQLAVARGGGQVDNGELDAAEVAPNGGQGPDAAGDQDAFEW